MEKRPKHHNIWILLQVRYPQFCPTEKPASVDDLHEFLDEVEENLSSDDDEKIGEFYAARNHLILLESTDSDELVNITNNMLAKIENNHPFNLNEYLATEQIYRQWLRYEYFTVEEAVALAVGRNPEKFDAINNSNDLGVQPIKSKINDALLMLARRTSEVENSNKIHSKDFLDWIKVFDIKQSKVIQKFIPTSTLSNSKNQKTSNSSAETNERNKMLKLILGMAMDKYGHNPQSSRTPTATKIRDNLVIHGIKISDDTIRKYLNEANELQD